MFTGIIEETVRIKNDKKNKDILTLTIEKPGHWNLQIGQSIAVDGVCLTVVTFDDETFTVELMPETTSRTTYGTQVPKIVNVERAMSAQSLFEGHVVQGHVDQLSTIISAQDSPQWRTLHVAYQAKDAGLLVAKGSIAIDGISLTIVEVADDWFSVSIIPHTIAHTTLGDKKKGDQVNLEFDVIAKLIARQFELQHKNKGD